MELISVIMPYYNNFEFVEKSVNSVLSQTHKKFELIIIYDDTDLRMLKKIKEIRKKDKRIRILINRKNIGAGKSRNNGIKIAKGNYIAFIDSDDLWNKKKLETQIKFMKKNKISFLHTSYIIIDYLGHKKKIIKAKKMLKYKDLIKSCDIGLSSVMLRTSLIKKNLFPELKTKEDYVVWLKLTKKKVDLIGLQKPLTYWRKLNYSLSSSIIQRILDAYRVFTKYEKKDFIETIFLIIQLSFNAIKKRYI